MNKSIDYGYNTTVNQNTFMKYISHNLLPREALKYFRKTIQHSGIGPEFYLKPNPEID